MSESHQAWSGAPIPAALQRLAWLCLIGAAWIILPAQTARWTFVGELMVHWTEHAAMLLLVPVIIWRRHRVQCVVSLLLVALAIWPWLLAAWSPRCAPVSDVDLTVASFNVFISNSQSAAAIPALRECTADVVALVEIDAADEASLRGDARWPYQQWVQHGSGPWATLGVALLSRHPVDTFIVHDLEGDVAIEARLICAGQPLHVFAIHPHAPIDSDAWDLRNRQLTKVAELVRGIRGPVVVLGDFNVTIADPAWRQFLRDSGMRRAGGTASATWPSWLGPCGIGIDHIIAGNAARVADVRSIALAGSDHRGLTAVVSVRP